MFNMPLGIDVSNNNGRIDWKTVRNNGVEFAFIKSTEGINFVDSFFEYNWKSAKDQNIVVGAYHYPRPEYGNTANNESDFFYDTVMTKTGGLLEGDMLALDIETLGNVDYSAWYLNWMEIIELYVQFQPLAYTSPGFIDSLNLKSKPKLGTYPLWLADWRTNVPTAPAPWTSFAFWQYTGHGSLPGTSGEVDLDRFNGMAERIKLYGKPADTKTPPASAIDVEALRNQFDNKIEQIKIDISQGLDELKEMEKSMWENSPS